MDFDGSGSESEGAGAADRLDASAHDFFAAGDERTGGAGGRGSSLLAAVGAGECGAHAARGRGRGDEFCGDGEWRRVVGKFGQRRERRSGELSGEVLVSNQLSELRECDDTGLCGVRDRTREFVEPGEHCGLRQSLFRMHGNGAAGVLGVRHERADIDVADDFGRWDAGGVCANQRRPGRNAGAAEVGGLNYGNGEQAEDAESCFQRGVSKLHSTVHNDDHFEDQRGGAGR